MIFLWDALICEFISFQLLASGLAHTSCFAATRNHKLPALCFQFLYSACTLYVTLSCCWTDEWQINSWLNGFCLWFSRLIEFVINIDDNDCLYPIPDSNLLTVINLFHSYYSPGAFSKCASGQQLPDAWSRLSFLSGESGWGVRRLGKGKRMALSHSLCPI